MNQNPNINIMSNTMMEGEQDIMSLIQNLLTDDSLSSSTRTSTHHSTSSPFHDDVTHSGMHSAPSYSPLFGTAPSSSNGASASGGHSMSTMSGDMNRPSPHGLGPHLTKRSDGFDSMKLQGKTSPYCSSPGSNSPYVSSGWNTQPSTVGGHHNPQQSSSHPPGFNTTNLDDFLKSITSDSTSTGSRDSFEGPVRTMGSIGSGLMQGLNQPGLMASTSSTHRNQMFHLPNAQSPQQQQQHQLQQQQSHLNPHQHHHLQPQPQQQNHHLQQQSGPVLSHHNHQHNIMMAKDMSLTPDPVSNSSTSFSLTPSDFATVSLSPKFTTNSSSSASSSGVMSRSGMTSMPSSQLMASNQAYYMDKFEAQMRQVSNDIKSTIQIHVTGMLTRGNTLLNQLDNMRKIYLSIAQQQQQQLQQQQQPISNSFMGDGDNEEPTTPFPVINFTKPDHALYKAVTTMGFLTAPAFAPLCTATGDGLDGSGSVAGQSASFIICAKNCFNDDILVGRESVSAKVNAFCDGVAPFNGDPNQQPSMSSSTTSSPPLKIPVGCHVVDHNTGKYTVSYTVPVLRNLCSHVEIVVTINGIQMTGCPFKVPVQAHQKQSWKKLTSFGTEGNAIGQFCRPWGVALARMPPSMVLHTGSTVSNSGVTAQGTTSTVTVGPNGQCHSDSDKDTSSSHSPSSNSPHGSLNESPSSSSSNNSMKSDSSGSTDPMNPLYLVAVADRSNNRIQVFRFDSNTKLMTSLYVFGSGPGTRPGQFDRPAGLCFNITLNYLVVADKDNHRVQVFDLTGKFLFKFGEKGNRAGQFCYPWDIDSCPTSHQLVVSDTRNRRIQLFSAYGQYLAHFSHPLDSPRGVGFFGDNKLVVSDFNKHRLLIFDRSINSSGSSLNAPPTVANNLNTKFIGFGEGSGWGEFLRPQGITLSPNYVFCSDSRNNRICLYNLVSQTFEYLSEDVGLTLDRPSGLAVLDNIMIVVDFGNNRLQILHR